MTGTERAQLREAIEASRRIKLYAATPDPKVSRQVRRATERAFKKESLQYKKRAKKVYTAQSTMSDDMLKGKDIVI